MKMKEKIRSPIVSVLGHVDHGKTSLLDAVRGTVIAKSEPGQITQSIGTTKVPVDIIKKLCGVLMDKMGIKLEVPGLLFIDTPGHEAFTTLRKRGGLISDLAILVIDVNEGFQPQTDESLNFLKQFKTPFVVAATKIDRIMGWSSRRNVCFIDTVKEQGERTQEILNEKIYKIVSQLSVRGFDSERYDRIKDFTKQVPIVPVSSVTGEGIQDLLVILAGVAQKYLKGKLKLTPGEGKGTVLEVKDFKGLGITIDAILYDGEIRMGDHLVIGGKEIIKTRVKALLEPSPLRELRVEKRFQKVHSVSAAAGIKIAAPRLENVIAGMPIRAVRDERDVDRVIEEIKEEIEEVEIATEREGVILRADTLGSLEALIKTLKDMLPIRKAAVGTVTKSDIMEVRSLETPIVFAFGVRVSDDIKTFAKDNGVKIFISDIIYRLLEEYKKFEQDRSRRAKEQLLKTVTRPGRIRILPGCIFRQSKPAIFGVEVLKGTIRPGYQLAKKGRVVFKIKEIQLRGENVEEAKTGDKVALSVPDLIIGKHVKENDVLETRLTESDMEKLEKIKEKLRDDEIELLEEIKEGN
jgi:translation initiation factor 5B